MGVGEGRVRVDFILSLHLFKMIDAFIAGFIRCRLVFRVIHAITTSSSQDEHECLIFVVKCTALCHDGLNRFRLRSMADESITPGE